MGSGDPGDYRSPRVSLPGGRPFGTLGPVRHDVLPLILALVGACSVPADPAGQPGTDKAGVEPKAPASPEEAKPSEPAGPELPAKFVDAAKKITAAARGTTRAYDRLADLSDLYGPRPGGSENLERAIDWAVETMKADGLDNARREKVMIPHWERGEESVRVVAPVERGLSLLGLGGSVGTGGEVLRGEVVVVGMNDEIAGRADELAGKIVLINRVMPPYDFEAKNSFYGETVSIRSAGPSEAARAGAKAALIRSVTAHSLRTPHTGALKYADDAPKIPAAAVSVEDAEFLARMAKRGPVTVELSMEAENLPEVESGNAIAELTGRELPEEIVVLGCHIDSWDVGDASVDDGSGCVMAMEAARTLKELELIPRRTIRVVLFTNEEFGLRGGKNYFEVHGQETHAGAIESDAGAAAPGGFGVVGSDEAIAEVASFAPLFEEIGATDIGKGWGGADISPLTDAGVLSLGLRPDGSKLFDYHHSPADTFDKIDPVDLQRNAAAMALMAYILAER